MRASAAAANVISNEQPCRVKLRIWRYSPCEDVPGTSGALKGKGKEKASLGKHHQSGAPLTSLSVSCQAGHVLRRDDKMARPEHHLRSPLWCTTSEHPQECELSVDLRCRLEWPWMCLLLCTQPLLLQVARRERTALLRQLRCSLLRRPRARRSWQRCRTCTRLKPPPGQLPLMAQALTTPCSLLAAMQPMTEALLATQLQ